MCKKLCGVYYLSKVLSELNKGVFIIRDIFNDLFFVIYIDDEIFYL